MASPRVPRTPLEMLHLSPAQADELLDDLERRVPVRPPVVDISSGGPASAVVFGDTHGDWRSTEEVVRRYQERDQCLIGLGDYVDRPPDDCGQGSVANALYLLHVAAEAPDRVYLVQGNHETVRRIPAMPHDLPDEIDELWGPDSTRYDRLLGLFERGPLAVTTSNGGYLAHAGFPRSPMPTPWTESFSSMDEGRLAEITWAECAASRVRRGAAPPWGAPELDEFLKATGLKFVVRGHDPDLTGRLLYGGRCLTLHTSRIYERYGGVIIARTPLDARVTGVGDLVIEHLPTEGQSYPIPD